FDEVWVLRARTDTRFVDEHRHERGLPRQVRQDALDDDRAAGRLLGQVQLRHAAGRDVPDDLVPTDPLRERCDAGLHPDHVKFKYILPMSRVPVVFALAVCLSAAHAYADDKSKALALFEKSDKAYKAGKFE